MLIIKTYTCKRFGSSVHSLKVIHNEKIKAFYDNLSDQTLGQLCKDYDSHSLVEHINVVKKADLK